MEIITCKVCYANYTWREYNGNYVCSKGKEITVTTIINGFNGEADKEEGRCCCGNLLFTACPDWGGAYFWLGPKVIPGCNS